MRTPTLLALLFLPLTGSCGDDVSASAKAAIDAAADAAKTVVDEIDAIDWSHLSPEAMKSYAAQAMSWILAELDDLKSSEAAQTAAEYLDPVVDELADVAADAYAELPTRDELRQQVVALRQKHADDPGITDALRGILDRLEGMVE